MKRERDGAVTTKAWAITRGALDNRDSAERVFRYVRDSVPYDATLDIRLLPVVPAFMYRFLPSPVGHFYCECNLDNRWVASPYGCCPKGDGVIGT